MKIRKFNEAFIAENKPFTVGDLKQLLEGISDDTPVTIINPVGRGSGNIHGEISLVKNDIYYSKSFDQYLQQYIPEEEALESSYEPVPQVLCIFSN